MGQNYSLQTIEDLKSSQLRQEFESFEGKLVMRDVSIERVTSKIVDLQERPSWCPHIMIFQIKEIDPELKLFWMYSEILFTSNVFVDGFEKFLREDMIAAPAKGFEDTPDEYLHYFKTPFSLVPVDIERTSVNVSYPGNGNEPKEIISQDKFKGVDFRSSCTLKMINPEILFNKLTEIEKAGNFSVVIKKVCGGTKVESVEAFEYRRGHEYKTIDHFVFKRAAGR